MTKAAPHPLDVHIGRQLRLRRKVLGMSQDALAKRTGITFQQIQKYERGFNAVSARRLHEFAAELKVSPMYFYHGYGEEIAETVLDDISAQAIHLVQNFSAIPSDTIRKTIADFVRTVAKGK